MKPLILAGLLLVLVAGLCRGQQTGGANAFVSGVVTGVSGEPLPGATLVLELPWRQTGVDVPPKPPPTYTTSSDAQGHFEFAGVKPDVYGKLSVELAGYVEQSRRGEGETLGRVKLTSGQKLTGVAFKLIRAAIITGRILNEGGDPVAGLRVTAGRRVYSPKGAVLRGRNVTSAADGTFSIDALLPGVYYLSVFSEAGQNGEAYIATYYPSAADPSDATAISLAAGAMVHLADMRVQKSRVYRIRGKIIDAATGVAPQGRVQVTIDPQDPGGYRIGSMSGRMVEPGTFDWAFFAPGVYVVDAYPTMAPPGIKPALSFTGRETVTVTNADVDVVLKVTPALEITGRVSPSGPGRIILGSLDGISFSGIGEFQPDGSFAIYSLAPSMYRVRPIDLPEGMYIKSVRYGDLNITKAPLDLTSGVKGQLNIQLAPNAADIAGIVRDADGAALGGLIVTMWTPGLPANAAADFSKPP